MFGGVVEFVGDRLTGDELGCDVVVAPQAQRGGNAVIGLGRVGVCGRTMIDA